MKCDGAKVREEAADIKRSKIEARKDLDTRKLNALNIYMYLHFHSTLNIYMYLSDKMSVVFVNTIICNEFLFTLSIYYRFTKVMMSEQFQ